MTQEARRQLTIYDLQDQGGQHAFNLSAASDGQHHFVLRGGNHEVIGTSEMYTSTGARDDGIDSVRRNEPTAAVERD
jgi:uncharacterized protein YegP (UPF0339 family)